MEFKARSLISASLVFLGLLFPLVFPAWFWLVVPLVALLASVFSFWIFHEKPNLNRVKEDWFTIIFITSYVIACGVFAYLVSNQIVQALILGATGVSLYFIYLAASRLKRGYTPNLTLRNIISLSAFLGVFVAIADVLRWATAATGWYVFPITILASFIFPFIISEFLFEIHGIEKSLLYSLVLSLGISQIVWISSFWLVSYPQSERITNLGVPLPAIIATVFYYLFWGLSQHRLDETLTKRVLWEYILISVVFVAILFLTTQWLPA